MMPSQDFTTVVALAAPATSVLALWLRLRYRLRGERERRQYLVDAAAALPPGSRVEESRDDGTRLALTVGTPQRRGERR